MATAKKSPASEEERRQRAREKARLRKQRFDERRRNPDGDDGANQRRGVVLHLSEAARTVLREHRQRRREADMPPVLDSELVESLLLAYARQGDPDTQAEPLVVDETKAHPAVAKLLAKVASLKADLQAASLANFAAEGTIERLEEEVEADNEWRPFDWATIEQRLLAAHRLIGSASTRGIVERVLDKSASSGVGAEAAALLQREIEEHIRSLIDWASRTE